jgi:hypothetical protein
VLQKKKSSTRPQNRQKNRHISKSLMSRMQWGRATAGMERLSYSRLLNTTALTCDNLDLLPRACKLYTEESRSQLLPSFAPGTSVSSLQEQYSLYSLLCTYCTNSRSRGILRIKTLRNGCPTVIGSRAGEGEEARVPENGGSDRPTALFLVDCAHQRARSTRFHT